MHCFGHIHEGYGIQVERWAAGARSKSQMVKVQQGGSGKEAKELDVTWGEYTLMVNAAIMD